MDRDSREAKESREQAERWQYKSKIRQNKNKMQQSSEMGRMT